MNSEKIKISLSPAESDPPLHSSDYQKLLREFSEALTERGMPPSVVVELNESVGSSDTILLGSFSIELTKAVGPVLGTIVGAFLAGRYGRKARLKIGDIEAEGRTPEEVERLLESAKKIRRSEHSGQ